MALNPPSSRAPHTGMARLGSSGHQGTDGMALNPPGRTDGMALNPPRSRLPDGRTRQLPIQQPGKFYNQPPR